LSIYGKAGVQDWKWIKLDLYFDFKAIFLGGASDSLKLALSRKDVYFIPLEIFTAFKLFVFIFFVILQVFFRQLFINL
jgi:hypothetical protein